MKKKKIKLDPETVALVKEFEMLQEKFLEADRLFRQNPDDALLRKNRQEFLDKMRKI